MENLKVVIIGGGMGGLTCGLFLRRAGYKVMVYERAPEILPVGAAISLWSNGTRVMNVLGLGSKIQAMGGNMNRMVYCDLNNNVTMNLDLKKVYEAVGERCYPVPRAELQQMLMDEYLAAGGSLKLGLTCVGVKHLESGEAVALFDDGSESMPCDLLIGADGINSKVRDYVLGDPKASRTVYHYTNWNGLVDMDPSILPSKDEWRMWVGEGKRASVMPVGGKHGNRFYFFMGAPLPSGSTMDDRSKRRAELKQVFKSFPSNVQALIDRIDVNTLNRIPISDLDPLDRYSRRNVVLIGDAAHGTTPTLGQGGCQAMEDAEVLAWFLQSTRVGLEDCLARYARARKDRVHDMVLKARSRTQTIYPQGDTKATEQWYEDLKKPETRANIENGLISNMLQGPFVQARL